MRRLLHILPVLCIVSALVVSCDSSSVSGPGSTKLKLIQPKDQTLQRGKTNDVAVSIARDDFTGPVAIEVTQLPAGVKVTNSKTEVPSTDKSTTLTLHAQPDAALVTNHRVIVIARAGDMEVAEGFKLTVTE